MTSDQRDYLLRRHFAQFGHGVDPAEKGYPGRPNRYAACHQCFSQMARDEIGATEGDVQR
jgi:hypothetical protein